MNSAAESVPVLRLMTLNIVRSTRAPLPAWAVPDRVKARTHATLGAVLESVDPHVLALQEVDAATVRHLDFGATHVGDPRSHAAFLASRAPVVAREVIRFRAQGFFRDKGFSAGAIAVPGFNTPVRVASVHLDAFSGRIRALQVDELCSRLASSAGPLIVVGDLNEEDVPGGAVDTICARLGLRTKKADAPTYDFLGVTKTLDWVLVSRELAFADQRVLPVRLSDHRAVVATIREAA